MVPLIPSSGHRHLAITRLYCGVFLGSNYAYKVMNKIDDISFNTCFSDEDFFSSNLLILIGNISNCEGMKDICPDQKRKQ